MRKKRRENEKRCTYMNCRTQKVNNNPGLLDSKIFLKVFGFARLECSSNNNNIVLAILCSLPYLVFCNSLAYGKKIRSYKMNEKILFFYLIMCKAFFFLMGTVGRDRPTLWSRFYSSPSSCLY